MRVYNFAAGPAMLPLSVLEKARDELVEYPGAGMSVMEMTHRSPMYQAIIDKANENLRKLMNIPDDYEVMFLQGGASTQFAMVPMNLMKTGRADYVVTGSFAKKAASEAKKFGTVSIAADSSDKTFSYIPKLSAADFNKDADYVHITTNNTIYGTSYRLNLPDTNGVELVADMSSNILSEEYDVSKFGLIYAGAQKNIGPSGVTIVIMKKSLIADPPFPFVPSMLTYKLMAENGSMYNTPPTYGIYMAGLTFENMLNNGGVAAYAEANRAKAKLLYDFLDNSKLFTPLAEKDSRSIMNVTFVAGSDERNAAFVKAAKEKGLVNLKGHRAAGGMRASIYNAMPIEGVKALVDFMGEYEINNK